MALVKCNECGSEISNKADCCPKCGVKIKSKPLGCGTILLILIIGFIALPLFFSVNSHQSYRDKAESRKSEIDNPPLTEKGSKIKSKHPDWNNNICNTVAKGAVFAGMTAEQAKAAWGKPYKINTTTYGDDREREQWVMHEYGNDYLYFENGVLTTIQTSK